MSNGANTDPPIVPPGPNVDPAGTPPPNVGTDPAHGAGGNPPPPAPPVASEADELLTRLKAENAAYRQKAREREEAAKVLEEQRLKEQGEFKQLAEKHETRVKELEPIAESYTKLAEMVHEQIKATIQQWPDEVKALVPGKDTPVEECLASLEKLKPLVEKLAGSAQRTPLAGARQSPRATGNPGEETPEQRKQKLLASGMYGF